MPKNAKSLDEIVYRAELGAVDRRFGRLKVLIPLGIVLSPVIVSAGGTAAAVGVGVVALGTVISAWVGSRKDWQGIELALGGDESDRPPSPVALKQARKVLWELTPPEDRPVLAKAFNGGPVGAIATSPTATASPSNPPPSPAATASPPSSPLTDAERRYNSILIWGPMGSGKSSFALGLIAERAAMGHKLIILNPHAYAGQYPDGATVLGGGKNYSAIDEGLEAIAAMETARYRVFESQGPGAKFEPITIVMEEITLWGERAKNAAPAFASALSDWRKINLKLIAVGHDRTLAALGGASGISKNRDNSLLEIALGIKHAPNGDPIPSFKGTVKRPGQAAQNADFPEVWFKQSGQPQPLPQPSPTASPTSPSPSPKTSPNPPQPSPNPTIGDNPHPHPHPPDSPKNCPHCGSDRTVSHGISPNDIPRRKCRDCGKTFNAGGEPSRASSPSDPMMWGV